ncbi:MAG: hypothetical protein ACHQEA_12530 [Gaiellales bacterium]
MTELAHIELHHIAATTEDAAELIERAWNTHPDRAEHEALRAETTSRGVPFWHEWLEPDPDDPEYVLLVFGPVDPLGGKARRIGRWHGSQIAA